MARLKDMTTTDQTATQWLDMAEAGGISRLDDIWNTPGLHRPIIAEALSALTPVESILEVGSGVGTNLALAHALGVVRLLGIEIDPAAVAYAAYKVPAMFVAGDLRVALGLLAPKLVDVSLACYTLAYIAPEELEMVLRGIVRVTRRAVILAEPQGPVTIHAPGDNPPCWIHNYEGLAAAVGLSLVGRRDVQVDQLNAVSLWRVV